MNNLFGENWKNFGANVWQGTMGIISLILLITISFSISKSSSKNPILISLVALSNLIIIIPSTENAWAIPYAWIGTNGIFVSIIISIVSTEIFILSSKIKIFKFKKRKIKNNLQYLIPTILTISVFVVIKLIFLKTGVGSFHLFIFNLFQLLINEATDKLPFVIYLVFLIDSMWFFGIHASNLLGPIIEPTLIAFMEQNTIALIAGEQPFFVATKLFYDVFVFIGGSGTSLAIILSIYLVSLGKGKKSNLLTITKISILPGIFNINEILIFGIPVLFNPILLLPFIIVPIVLSVISYFSILYGIVPTTTTDVAWTVPPILSGYITTGSFRGSLLQVLNLVVASIIYYPFIKMQISESIGMEDEVVSNNQNKELTQSFDSSKPLIKKKII